MPSTKQGGGHTLTFSKKNKDVKELLGKYKKEAKDTEKSFIANDYICEAIRFYEKNKSSMFNENTNITLDIEKLVEEKIKELIGKKEESITKGEKNNILEEELPCEDIEED